jgi:type II secretion system protein J
MTRSSDHRRRSLRRGFTMLEFILAGILLAMVLVAMGMAMQQVVKARNATRGRVDAHIRADAALRMIRRDLVSLLRREDLFYTRVLLTENWVMREGEEVSRDEILVFNNRMQSTRDLLYNGDGMEFETQYRVEDDDLGPMLWQRRDPMPDAYPEGGGIVTPVVEGIMGLDLQAWNGIDWLDEWDSDEDGLPWAFRVTVTATGAAPGQPTDNQPIAVLRTVVPIDRSRMPMEVADARLAEEILDRFMVDPGLLEDITEAVATASPPPIPRSTAPGDGSALEVGGAAAAVGGAAGGGSQTIETPVGTVIIGPDGNATLQGGGGGSSSGSRGPQ